jgi:hypothetical protein
MLITGHSSKGNFEVYQHLALKDIEEKYQQAMRKLEFELYSVADLISVLCLRNLGQQLNLLPNFSDVITK